MKTRTMIDTRVPVCRIKGCSGALDKGFLNLPEEYQGTYYFCTHCHTQYRIIAEGQAENELLCEYEIPYVNKEN